MRFKNYINKYASSGDVQTALESGQLNKPYVALINNEIDYNSKSININSIPLTFEITGNGTIYWKAQSSTNAKTIEYRLNGGQWTSITSTTEGTAINAETGDIVQFRGNNTSYRYNSFSASTVGFKLKGNIMSLINKTNFASLTTIQSERTFVQLFGNCTGLTDASELLLPATTLANYCYSSMFAGCTSLVNTPALPATTLTDYCYMQMFQNCSSLVNAPVLSATTLANSCYAAMFNGCSSLVNAPALPATTLTNYCYQQMFEGCTSLVTAPELLATTLTNFCYFYMFNGCSNLNYIKCLATDISANNCTNNWVNGVSSTGTFVKATSTDWTTGDSGIPSNWTVQNIGPAPVPTPTGASVPFTIEVLSGGTWDFSDNDESSAIAGLQFSINDGEWQKGYYYDDEQELDVYVTSITFNSGDTIAFKVNTESGDFDKENFIRPYSEYGGLQVPYNIYGNLYSLKNESFEDLTDLNDADGSDFDYLFGDGEEENEYLIDASELLLPATSLTEYCYDTMFGNCTNLVGAPELPATTLADHCYSQMFKGCSSLTTAPDLPATEYANGCYPSMFEGCSNLTSARIATYDLSNIDEEETDSPCSQMFDGIETNGTLYVSQDAYDTFENDFIDRWDNTVKPENWDYSIIDES